MKLTWTLMLLAFTLDCGVAQAQNERSKSPDRGIAARVTTWLSEQDANGDGKIAPNESRGPLKANFQRVDANGDGQVDRRELSELARRLARNTQRRPRQANGLSDAQVRTRAGDQVTVELNLAYREGNDAWRLDLAYPKEPSDVPRPAIVFVHGGGWRGGDKRTAAFIGPTLEYAAKGYVCITVNYRLERTLHCIEDVKCAVRWLRAHADKYDVDPKRIGAYGNSAGAHLVMMLGLSADEKRLEGDGPWESFSSGVQAVAASATPTRPQWPDVSDEDRKLAAPMTFVRPDAPPLLLFHEASDRTVNVSNSDELVAALKKAGAKDVTYQRYTDGSGHGVFRTNLKETGPAMESFFDRTLRTTAAK